MKIIAVVDATFAKAKRIRLWDLNVKLEQFSKTSKHRGCRTTGEKKGLFVLPTAGSLRPLKASPSRMVWGPVISQHSGSNNSIVKSNGCEHKAPHLVDIQIKFLLILFITLVITYNFTALYEF